VNQKIAPNSSNIFMISGGAAVSKASNNIENPVAQVQRTFSNSFVRSKIMSPIKEGGPLLQRQGMRGHAIIKKKDNI
jgi:hypothetical protein